MLVSYKLPLAFDTESLKADLERIPSGAWVAHFNRGYYEGEWKGLALRSTTGRANQLFTLPFETAEAADTAVLDGCPYFRRVLDAFECPIHAARLLSLGPGAKILEHKDDFIGVEDGLIRVHIPVVSDSRVEFFVADRRLVLPEGEAWYIDFGLPHRVNNASDKERVHLVVDCKLNGWLEGMIPFDGRRG
ncbi:MAG TPA: aspartyl/asparaginyl beta-hydroxylase domain-containing protein [Pyrinomonadaceae bacterium]|jgi:quercetin dioxygenase-like cupin family protein|nr:aspartyl/asparaginyl beta-hydroxylase domain-containing protein [Pyrinomonadaceae bacterium]